MKIAVNMLTGAALDWMVAKCQGYLSDEGPQNKPHYKGSSITPDHFLKMRSAEGHGVHWTHGSTEWDEAGPIIFKERISLNTQLEDEWVATTSDGKICVLGHDPLVVAMQCYVIAMQGEFVDVSDVLLQTDSATNVRHGGIYKHGKL